jgi:hypothetical protein
VITLLVCLVKAWFGRMIAPKHWWEPFADLRPSDLGWPE